MKTVLVAMSGGVDSSVAAALLKDAGYTVIGITMQLLPKVFDDAEDAESCCGVRGIRDAQLVAAQLEIPHYVFNMRKQFHDLVIDNFTDEYRNGKTPNPCIRCNQFIKFGVLLQKADELDADYIATGHYARIVRDEKSVYLLKKGVDREKDQSYFLYVMSQPVMKRTLMPLGEFTKYDVRKLAGELDLRVSAKPESQEICFIEGNNYRRFFEQSSPQLLKPGPIVSKEGEILGTHKGIMCYTIGQRRGLGIASGTPLYVTGIDRSSNSITVGERDEVYHRELEAHMVHWITGEQPHSTLEVQAKIRSLHEPADAELKPCSDGTIHLTFKKPQWAITPGQAVVCYSGDTVICGGVITRGR